MDANAQPIYTTQIVAENYTENFGTLKLTLKINIKEGFTENFTEKLPLLFRNGKKKRLLTTFLSKLNTNVSNFIPFIKYVESLVISLKI